MKLTESTLRRIIKEELQNVLNQNEKETYKVILDYHGELERTFSSKQEAIDAPVIIPPDGNTYEFICIENPLPGAWTFSFRLIR